MSRPAEVAPAPHRYDYAREHPTPEHVLLVCEVASSSLAYDRSAKAEAYARSGISAYWIIDVESRVVHVLTEPDRTVACYRRETSTLEGDVLPVPGGSTIGVAEVLPRI